jgi:hypothetical protein
MAATGHASLREDYLNQVQRDFLSRCGGDTASTPLAKAPRQAATPRNYSAKMQRARNAGPLFDRLQALIEHRRFHALDGEDGVLVLAPTEN